MYELWDVDTATLVETSDSLEALAEYKVELRDSVDVSSLRILERADDGSASEVVE